MSGSRLVRQEILGGGVAARIIIKAAAKAKLEPTRRTLQTSAVELIDRMIELKEAA